MTACVTEYIKGDKILENIWNVGDEIVYNSEPEDIERKHLHVHRGIIDNIFVDNKRNTNTILIRLPYGKMTIPLHKITILIKTENKTNNNKIQRFFMYGTLRDDDDSKAAWSQDWSDHCTAQDGRLYKFSLYKEKYAKFPFAVKTNNKYDYINGRIISWNDPNIFELKLADADNIEGYTQNGKDNFYERCIVDVMDETGQMVEAIVYYRNIKRWDQLECCYELPDGDWKKRHWLQNDIDDDTDEKRINRNDTKMMKKKVKEMIRKIKREQDKLIDSLPLPDAEGDDEHVNREWFSISGHDIAVINAYKTAQKFRSQTVHSVFGTICVKSNTNDIYKWTFNIDNGGGLLVIGIVSVCSNMKSLVNAPFYRYDHFENYGYNVFNGYKISRNVYNTYTVGSKTNDVIDMELNMKTQTLTFYINGNSQNIAFDNIKKSEKIRYQMAVSLQQDKNQITLQNFKIINQ